LKDKKLIRADGSSLDALPSNTMVSLWHPLHSDSSDCEAWRNYIWTNSIKQPFRQAFREVYLECQTNNNPLNVDGLFVRQHQFRALLLSKGWRYRLRGNFECDSSPELKLKRGISCEICIAGESTTTSNAGISLAVELAEIRFSREGKILSTSELRPIEYSEVMRDIDLFTSISGLGYQEDWAQIEEILSDDLKEKLAQINGQISILCNGLILDNDPLKENIVEYLCAMSMSVDKLPIPETVKTRAILLGFLLQKSKIADKVYIDGRYVHVDTTDGGYKINLATGLVFSAKDNQLLPISIKHKEISNAAGSDTLLSRVYSLVLKFAEI
jgi:hypothetical protein